MKKIKILFAIGMALAMMAINPTQVWAEVETEEPTLVTEENYEELGLTADYVGYMAIANRAQLAWMADLYDCPMTDVAIDECVGLMRNMNNQIIPARHKRMTMSPGSGSSSYDPQPFVLTADITINENLIDEEGSLIWYDAEGNYRTDILRWAPLDLNENYGFVFDGNGHTISGLYIMNYGYCCGFVGSLSGEIRNLGIGNSYYESIDNDYVGAIAGYSEGRVENCWSDAVIKSFDASHLGGLIGACSGGSVIGSTFSGVIEADNNPAGVIGYAIDVNSPIVVKDCHFSGKIVGKKSINSYSNAMVSGLLSEIRSFHNISIDSCSADGEVVVIDCDSVYGFIKSLLSFDGDIRIRNSYNAMKVTGTGTDPVNVVGMYGSNNEGPILSVAPFRSSLVFEDEEDFSEYNMVNCFSCFDLSEITPESFEPITPNEDYSFSMKNCFYLAEEDDFSNDEAMAVSAETFASGKVAYLLNQTYLQMYKEAETGIWFQMIGKDKHPVFTGDEYSVVYSDDEGRTCYNLSRSIAELSLNDDEAYSRKSKILVEDFTYNRAFENVQWEALYVPFEIDVNAWKENFDIAAIRNFHEYYDAAGAIEYRELEVRILKSGQTKANYPYLIRAKVAGEKSIEMQNVTLYSSKENAISCASTDTKYTFSGIYSGLYLTFASCYVEAGYLCASDLSFSLAPQRWYLTAEKYDTQWQNQPTSEPIDVCAGAIRIFATGEEETGICEIENGELKMENSSFNLQGQRLTAPQKGLNIINGQRRLIK